MPDALKLPDEIKRIVCRLSRELQNNPEAGDLFRRHIDAYDEQQGKRKAAQREWDRRAADAFRPLGEESPKGAHTHCIIGDDGQDVWGWIPAEVGKKPADDDILTGLRQGWRLSKWPEAHRYACVAAVWQASRARLRAAVPFGDLVSGRAGLSSAFAIAVSVLAKGGLDWTPKAIETFEEIAHATLDVESEQTDDEPKDTISTSVALQEFAVSRSTLGRRRKTGKLRGYRADGAPKNAEYRYSRADLAKLFTPRKVRQRGRN